MVTSLLWLRNEDALALSGTVKDGRGEPLAGALVTLASDPSIRAVTGVRGLFTTGKPAVSRGGRGPRAAECKLAGFGLDGNRLLFQLPASQFSGTLAFSRVNGRRRLELPLGPFGAGDQQVDMPDLEPGVYSLRITLGPFSGTAHLIRGRERNTLIQKPPRGREAAGNARRRTTLPLDPADIKDTLLVRRAGFVTARHPLMSYHQDGIEVVMARE